MSNTTTPAAKVTLYPITAAIWRNDVKGQALYSATFEKSYRDDASKWKASHSFSAGDLLLLAKVADLVHSEIHKLRANDQQTQQSEE